MALCLIHRWPNFGWKKRKKKATHIQSWPLGIFGKDKIREENSPDATRAASNGIKRIILVSGSIFTRKEWNGTSESEKDQQHTHNRPTFQPGTGLRVEGEFSGAEEEESETRVNRRGWWWQWSMQNFSPMYTGKIGSWGPITTDVLRYRYGCPWRKKDKQRARLLTSACCGRDACLLIFISWFRKKNRKSWSASTWLQM